MSLILSNVSTEIEESSEDAIKKAMRRLGVTPRQVQKAALFKTSVDARRRPIRFVHSVSLTLASKELELQLAAQVPQTQIQQPVALDAPQGDIPFSIRPVVVGFGPAGMFAALYLAEQGCRPIVLERGESIDQRVQTVQSFWDGGQILESSNVQFGEGGAGAFSDGKLTTRIHDSRCRYVLEQLVRFGAPEEILTKAKPHIGTDLLRNVVRAIRQKILALGGEFRFSCLVEKFYIEKNKLKAIQAGGEKLPVQILILAIGHSARDTFSTLQACGVSMEPKPFSVGVRVEQRQQVIEEGLYGPFAGHPLLPKGEYALSHRLGKECVYTFCMCPGGLVVPAASEVGGVVTNGMSYHARNGENANSALVVSVNPRDIGTNLMEGIHFQRKLEQKAYKVGGDTFSAPAQDTGSFLKERSGLMLGRVMPTYFRGVTPTDFSDLFPEPIIRNLKLGLHVFGKKLPGFSQPDTLLTGVETRTSSPIRILRDPETLMSNISGLYPCGEGAGYAGGIMSAAVDGLRVAQLLLNQYCPGKW